MNRHRSRVGFGQNPRMHRRLLLFVTVVSLALAGFPATDAGAAEADLVGRVLDREGDPLEHAVLTSGSVSISTDPAGRFDASALPPGRVTVSRPAFATRSFEWDGRSPWTTIRLAPKTVRGIHVAGWVAASNSGFQRMLDVGAASSVNALVIDIKNENGRVYHRSTVPRVAEIGAQAAETFDLAERTDHAHAQGFTVITRIVTFQDPLAAATYPSWAVLDTETGAPLDNGGQVFLDPTDSAPREYALALAEEACAAGVDEVQFDYIRFPDGGTDHARFDGPADPAGRQAAITAFLEEARSRLLPMGCATAADIFGWITNTPTEGGIGQQFEAISAAVDVVSPMIYPSHYSSGWYGFANPNDHPAAVVTFASRDALQRMDGSPVVLRPWLQDFWYTPDQVRDQIVAVDGLDLGWMLWNIRSEFSVGGIPLTPELTANEVVPPVGPEPPPSSGFWDVPDHHPFSDDVAWLAANRITGGCNPPWNDEFCPDEAVTRGQMAAFLVRALGLPPGTSEFSDSAASVFVADIGALAEAGITKGCNPPANTRFCPDEAVTRAQMAAFLVRALGLPPGTSEFSDSAASVFVADIGALAEAGITKGCNPPANTRFCPDEAVTRAQMAAFLRRALD